MALKKANICAFFKAIQILHHKKIIWATFCYLIFCDSRYKNPYEESIIFH